MTKRKRGSPRRAPVPGGRYAQKVPAVRWTTFAETLRLEACAEITGGWVGEETLDQYLQGHPPDVRERLQLVATALNSSFPTGHAYRTAANGAPLFVDGKTILFTQRAWADFMAARNNSRGIKRTWRDCMGKPAP